MNEIKQSIQKLLSDPNVTNYQVYKETGISQVSLSKFAKGESDIDNMPLGNAVKLYTYYLKMKEDGQLKSVDRDLLFGRLLGVANILSERVFEKDKLSISEKYMARFRKNPAEAFTKIHAELMEYTHKFGKEENKLFSLFDEIFGEMNDTDYTSEPLGDKYLLGYYKQQHALADLIEKKEGV